MYRSPDLVKKNGVNAKNINATETLQRQLYASRMENKRCLIIMNNIIENLKTETENQQNCIQILLTASDNEVKSANDRHAESVKLLNH